jgi:FixJ family two-component response regulator
MPIARHVVAVVEDDDAMRKSIDRLLCASGYATRMFSNARQYLDSGLSGVAGLILDIHLPDMSGLELQRRLLASGSTVPVVFVTAFDHEATRIEAQSLGCVAYLRKPFEAMELAEAMRRCIKSAPRA